MIAKFFPILVLFGKYLNSEYLEIYYVIVLIDMDEYSNIGNSTICSYLAKQQEQKPSNISSRFVYGSFRFQIQSKSLRWTSVSKSECFEAWLMCFN